jgi:RNA polymerase sigma-70 factor (ECF subfamily)
MRLRRTGPPWNDETSDEELVTKWRAGHREAFDPLYERYAEPIYRYAYRLLGDRDRAQDLCSDTFHRAVRSLGSFRGPSFRPWLFSIAHNALSDELRRAQRWTPLELADAHPDSEPSPEEVAVERASREDLVRLIAQLPPEQRHTRVLRMEGLSVEETTEALGKSKAAVYQNYHRAIVRLGELMREEDAVAEGGRRHG